MEERLQVNPMRILAPLLLLLAAACATAPRAAEPNAAGSIAAGPIPPGTYHLTAVGSRGLPARSPTERGVTIWSGSLALEAGARYRMELRATVGDQPSTAVPVEGAYRIAGDSLFLTPAASAEAATPARFRFTLAGPLLRLRDEDGHEYTFSFIGS
jgi:hypothetical protein